jgi:hypothetical protein
MAHRDVDQMHQAPAMAEFVPAPGTRVLPIKAGFLVNYID